MALLAAGCIAATIYGTFRATVTVLLMMVQVGRVGK